MAGLMSNSRMRLIVPFLILLIVVLIHAIYWIVVAGGLDDRARRWIAAQEAAGYEIEHAGLRVGGYPFRFSLRAAEPRITAPQAEGGWTLELDRLAVSAQFYDLTHWIATLGGGARFVSEVDGETVSYLMTADLARLSLSSEEGATTQVGATIDNLTLVAEAGPPPAVQAAERVVLSGRIGEDDQFAFRLQADQAVLAEAAVSPQVERAFGRTAQVFRMDGALTEWSVLAAGDPFAWTADGGAVVINAAQLVFGPADLNGAGEITLDPELRPAGRLSLVVTDPETLITALVESGLVHDEQGEALRLFALMAPRRDTGIALPFRLQDGGLFLGPARIGSVGAVD
ncbi:MAG: DUF2125 domain-containing protein [Oceanicaulis sp.]